MKIIKNNINYGRNKSNRKLDNRRMLQSLKTNSSFKSMWTKAWSLQTSANISVQENEFFYPYYRNRDGPKE